MNKLHFTDRDRQRARITAHRDKQDKLREARMERITTAAIRDDKGRITTLPRPARHSDIVFQLAIEGDDAALYGSKGFMTTLGRFVERGEGMNIAVTAGQTKQSAKMALNTEDLW